MMNYEEAVVALLTQIVKEMQYTNKMLNYLVAPSEFAGIMQDKLEENSNRVEKLNAKVNTVIPFEWEMR